MGDLRDLPVRSLSTVLVERGEPTILGEGQDRGPDGLVHVEPDGEGEASLTTPVHEVVRCAGGVGAHQDLDLLDVLDGDLLERAFGDRYLIAGIARTGITRPEHPRERLA